MRYIVAFYEIDRACGGPEEGGWYYDTGSLVRLYQVFANENGAWRAANRANRLLERLQRHRRPVSSAAYDGGRFQACVFDRVPPEHFPANPPSYE